MASQNFGAFVNAAAAATLAGTDLIPAVQASVTKKTTPNDILALLSTRTVAQGGTGLTTLTDNAVMLGNGTGNVEFATIGTAGRLLIDQGAGANPSFNAMSGDAVVTSGGVITVNNRTGATDGSNAPAGKAGEIFTSTLALASATALVNLTAKTITSITLTAGRWLIFGLVGSAGNASTTIGQIIGAINTATNALPADESWYGIQQPNATITSPQVQVTVPTVYVTISGSTTYYLINRTQFFGAGSACNGFGRITAVRI